MTLYYRHINLGATRPGATPGGWPAMVLGVLGLVAALLLGLFFFTFFLGVALVAGVALAARAWWLARKGALAGGPAGSPDARRAGTTLDGEYRVLEGRSDQGEGRGEGR